MRNASPYLPLAAGLSVVAVRLWSTMHRVAPGMPRGVVWTLAIVVLGAGVFRTVRTARGLRRMSAEAGERAVYNLAFLGLLIVALALSVPDFFAG